MFPYLCTLMSTEVLKADPSNYLNCFRAYLNDLRIKSLIPIPYEQAKEEVYMSMVEMFKTEVEQDIFKTLVDNFHSITDVEKWYEDRSA